MNEYDTQSEITNKADFSIIRYAQCWEDADMLLAGLNIQPGETCLSIASAGDNTLSLLTRNPQRVIALDLNPVQLYCLELRIAAYRNLTHAELLAFMGSVPSGERSTLYKKLRIGLSAETARFWDGQLQAVEKFGAGGVGKFERYFRIFSTYIVPMVHSKKMIQRLFEKRSPLEREQFFNQHWNSWRWRLLIKFFFSQTMMGKLGRDPAFFNYVEGSFSDHVFRKIKQGMVVLDPTENPYLQWIFNGRHLTALPHALREENFNIIRQNLDRLEWHLMSTETFAQKCRDEKQVVHKMNLSNIFEYMSSENYLKTLADLVTICKPGGRLFYWNMMVPREAPQELAGKIILHQEEAQKLHRQDKAIFYSRLVIEEVS